MTDLRKLLAENMKSHRKNLGISQAELAEKIGTAPTYISKIEALRQFPSVEMLEKIAFALEVDTIDLFHKKTKQEAKIQIVENDLISQLSETVRTQMSRLR